MKVQIVNQIVFPVLAAMALVGCSKDSLVANVDPAPIAFNILSDAQTKATPVESGNLSQIKVKTVTSSGAAYFENTFSKPTSGTSWTSTGNVSYYWPASGTLSFLAYYPADLTTGFVTAEVENDLSAIHTFKPKQSAGQQSDFLVGKRVGLSNSTSSVNLYMKHALCQIEIQAKCSNPNMLVKVKGVKIANVFQQAKIVFPTDGINDATSTLPRSVWQNASSNGRITYYAGGISATSEVKLTRASSTVQPAAQSLMMGDGSFMLIPQGQSEGLTQWGGGTGTGTYIAVLCQIWQKNTTSTSTNDADYPTLIFPTSQDKYGYAAVGIQPDWDPGKKYTYTLDFFSGGTGGAGQIPPEKTDPSNTGSTSVDTGTGSVGTNVAGGALSFTVTTSAFTTVSGNATLQ